MRGVLVMVVLAGCGRLSFDDHADGGNKDAPDGGALACNAITRLADDFATDQRATLWADSYTDDTSSIAIANREVTLHIAANAPNSYVGLVSSRYYDLRGQRMFAGVVHPANPKTTGGVGIGLTRTTLAHLVVEDGQLIAVREVDGAYVQTAVVPYDPVAHRYFAMEERDGRLYWETSPDGKAFTSLYDEPDPFDLALVDAHLFAGLSIANADPGTFVFDSFNGGSASASVPCKASALVDSFDDATNLWGNSFADACCTESQSNGQVVLATNGKAGFAGRRSSAGYDLRDSGIAVGTKGPRVQTKLVAGVTAVIDKGNYLELEIDSTQYQCSASIAGALHQIPAAKMDGDAYVRLRESAGTVLCEASPDATTWRVLATIPTPFDVSDVLLGVEIGDDTNNDNPNDAAFESVNAP